jgi:methyl-accepting chemotaxis protein
MEDEFNKSIAEVLDEFEFKMFFGMEDTTKSITLTSKNREILEKELFDFIDVKFNLMRRWLLVRAYLENSSRIIIQIVNENNPDLITFHVENLTAAFGWVEGRLKNLDKTFSDNDREILKKINGFYDTIKSSISQKDGLIQLQHQLLIDLGVSKKIAKSITQQMAEIHEMTAKTINEIEKKANEAGKSARSVVVFSKGAITITSIVVIILGLIIALALAAFISKNLNLVSNFLSMWVRDLSERKGNLNARLTMNSKDELGVVGNSFNTFLDCFSETVKIMRQSAAKIDENAKHLVSASLQVNSALSQINSSIQQISVGAQTQVSRVTLTSEIIKKLTASLHDIDKNAKEVNAYIVDVSDQAIKGRDSNQELEQKIDSIAQVVEEANIAVMELGKRSDQIGNITNTINSFADQTNLLSLNAAIEAARAGESGRGFAVVAEEVRKLAEGSSRSVNEIAKLIKEVQDDVAKVVTLIGKGKNESELGKTIAIKVSALQINITVATKKAEKMAGEISQLIPFQLSEAEKANASIIEISGIAQENASTTQEVSSSTEEMTSSMQELVASTNILTDVVKQLQDLVNQFKE